MHILLIHQAFVPPNEPGGTRHYELARHLVKSGDHFTIVASDVSYLTGKSIIAYKGIVREQWLDGVRVLRSFTYPSLHRSFVLRAASFFSFMVTSVLAALRTGPFDLVMGTSPPIFQAVSAWLVASLRQKPYLLEIRDLWPEFAIDMGILTNPLLIYLSRWLERFLYSRADHFLVNSPAYHTYLINKTIQAENISLIPNGVDTSRFDPGAKGESIRKLFNLNGKFVVTYAGALGPANDIITLIEAADHLRNERSIHFLIIGDGKERINLENASREKGLRNVTFTGARPKEDMPLFLAASDACVAILRNIPMFRTTYPNKVFDYMAAARPIILAIDGVIREVMEKSHGGIFVPPGNHLALADAVKGLTRDPQKARALGRNARAYVTERFDRKQQAEQFVTLLRKLSKARSR